VYGPGHPEAERRQLTVLWCREALLPATTTRLDPEDLHQILQSVQQTAETIIEEMTKMLLESDLMATVPGNQGGHPPALAIPATLHDSLMARLDRHGIGKLVAQLGATLGREFSYDMLQAISPLEEPALRQGLAQLVQAEIIYQRGLPPHAQYTFKHALIQETAYQSLLRHNRQQYHSQIAHLLEERWPDTCTSQPEILAHHYTEASLTTTALAYWQRAGQHALARSAHLEAIAHVRRGLALAATLPPTLERARHELALCPILGVALMATQGYAAPEVEQTYLQAQACCQQVGDMAQLFTTQVEASLSLSRQHALPLFVALGTVFQGGLQAIYTRTSIGVESIRQGIDAYRATGAELFRPYFLGLLAEAYGHIGQSQAGLQVLDEALSQMETTGEYLHASEIYRRRGELLPPGEEAEACFQQALATARAQEARALELRAAVCLSRFWQRQGKLPWLTDKTYQI